MTLPGTGPFDPVRPRYGAASLADVLPSALAALGVPGAVDALGLAGELAGVRRIAVLLVDGLGWHQLPVAAPYAPTLAELTPGARQLTSGFPSTTPTSLVSLGAGAPPGAHGVLGFRVNVPGTDRVLTHIAWGDDPQPARWQPVPTQLERARAAGVAVTAVTRPEYEGSGLTVAANRGGAFRGATGVDALAAEMLAALCHGDGPTLVSGYHPDLDREGHAAGVDSVSWRAAASDVDRLLARLRDGLPADGALLVTADHGQLNVPAEDRFDLDADPRLRNGVRVVAGEARVRYLHTVPGAVDDVIAVWRGVLGDAAWVASREEAVAAGWFGPVPEAHLGRVGDVVVACHGSSVVLATRSDHPAEAKLVAYHGSYTAAEMMIPLFVLRR
ncbi:Predicted pyrophosphatase or phosphodiesterase, AlkP superfamily [Micromonospora pattaloongensis]|uniref:Predicted pyrophosphatase or phosphodiesterase, AlkP superfamily n=1 Tax=Micromonospora pattaloongensis TaxID=405436 RepID=A0A1H3Q1F3_9ACTN|nr:nucleotide pyrophosphatase/phosphodiesterase family protein [Micromonospora pattaloongensis]SDZ07362.1 Predicted pyrophosphatase or phosphodiesterase, AlkP superfamily [Micromonospora pattaloongensis]